MSFIEKLTARLTNRREKAVVSFDALVRAVADDKPPTAEDAEAVLADSGLRPEDLAAAVQRLKDRRAAAATLKRGQAAQAELETIHTKGVAADAAYNAAVEKLARERTAVTAKLQHRAGELERQVEAARQAEVFLRESADRSATAEQEARLNEQLAEARRRRDECVILAQKAARVAQEAGSAANIRRDNWNNPMLNSDEWRRPLREKADAADKEESEWTKKAEPHAAEVSRLEGELTRLDELSLVP